MNFRVRHITSCRLKRSHLQPVAEQNIAPSRLRNSTTPSPLSLDDSECTRSYNTKSKPQPKELDSDDEDLVFNNQFTLRMPPREDCDKLKKAIAPREVGDGVWFKFKGVHGSCRIHGFIPFDPEHQYLL